MVYGLLTTSPGLEEMRVLTGMVKKRLGGKDVGGVNQR